MINWDWLWTIIVVLLICWITVHLISAIIWQTTLRVYRLRLSHGTTAQDIGRWMGQLAGVLRPVPWWNLFPRWPIGIELMATERGVRQLVVMPARLQAPVAASLAAALPGARLTEEKPSDSPALGVWRKAGEIRLRGKHQLLAVHQTEDTSRHVLAALQPVRPGELVCVQWLLAGARIPRAVTDLNRSQNQMRMSSSGITIHDQHYRVGVRWREPEPVLSAVCRLAVASPDRHHAGIIARRVWAALRGQNVSGSRITRRWLLPTLVAAARLSYRSIPLLIWPLTLTCREIAGVLGLATGALPLPGVSLGMAPTLPPSPTMPSKGVVIARANYPGINQLLCLAREDRLRHLWIAGPTGVGKSTLLANLISYDIHWGDPVIVIDAGGDLVTDVLARIPESRHEDVIVLDPTSNDHLIGLNPLRSLGSDDHELAAGLVFHALESIYASSWGPRTADIIRAGLLTLTMTRAPDGQHFTIGELTELLTNSGFRRFVINQPLTPALDSFWSWYDALSDTQRFNIINPALNKLRAFSLYNPLRLTLGQSEGINFSEVIENKRIVMVPVRTGILGAETATLIGSLVMAAVWQATLARARLPKEQRHPVWLYADEFQRVVRLPIDLADMLAQARGFGLGLIMAHQYLHQLGPEIKAAVLGTTRSQLIFQLETTDAAELAPRFTPLTREDLTNLSPHEIVLRPCVAGITLAPVTGITYPLPPPTTDPTGLTQLSLRRYGIPHGKINQQISERTLVTPTLDRHANRMNTGNIT